MPRRSQRDRSAVTQAALLAAGRRLFAEHGYDNVSAQQIVAAAGMTRGALYHHHRDKRELFRAVVEDLEAEVTAELAATVGAGNDPESMMLGALGAYLDLCQRPEVARILLIDAPAVLGWPAWRELEAHYGLGLVTRLLEASPDTPADVAVPVLAQLVLTVVTETALIIAHSEDPAGARARAEPALTSLLSGLLPPS